jgi:hypothetical protein
MMKPRFLTLSSMIVLAALSRLMPHPWNFTPIAAIALLGGAQFENSRHAFMVPFAALILSDVVLGFHSTMLFVYPAFGVIILLGTALKNNRNVSSVFFTTVGSSLLFFFITNFGSWVFDPFYTKDFSGLVSSYVRGLPFLRHTFLGDLFYVGILFGSFVFLEKRHPRLKYQPQ